MGQLNTVQEWLGEDNQLGADIWERKYRYRGESFQQWLDRVSGGDNEVRRLIAERKFLFGGRVLFGRGTEEKISVANCYTIPLNGDNLEAIFGTARDAALTYSRGGGCGISLDKLRPRGAKVNNAAKHSSGAVSFMEIYNSITNVIGSEGRRGALILLLDVSHPDIEEFIKSKDDLSKINSANISVKITDEFMFAVQDDENWRLRFECENGEVIEREVRAKDLFRLIAEHAWQTGEPGVAFMDTVNSHSLLEYHPEWELVSANPCGSL